MGTAELANLLDDCLVLWGVAGRMRAEVDGLHLAVDGGEVVVSRGVGPVRWMLRTPGRTRPRGAASIVGLLGALRAALGVPAGARLRIGAGAGMAGG